MKSHSTKKFILNPVEDSRSAPTRSSNQNQSVMGWQWGNIPWKHSPYIEVSDVLCYKPIPIIYRTSLLQNSVKAIITIVYVCEVSSELLVNNSWRDLRLSRQILWLRGMSAKRIYLVLMFWLLTLRPWRSEKHHCEHDHRVIELKIGLDVLSWLTSHETIINSK